MNCCTSVGQRLANSRNAHESAFTTIGSRSARTNRHMSSVREGSPLPPRARLFNGTVLTTAARRHQRSGDRAQRRISASVSRRARHIGPETKHARTSTSSQLSMPRPRRRTSLASRARIAGGGGGGSLGATDRLNGGYRSGWATAIEGQTNYEEPVSYL